MPLDLFIPFNCNPHSCSFISCPSSGAGEENRNRSEKSHGLQVAQIFNSPLEYWETKKKEKLLNTSGKYFPSSFPGSSSLQILLLPRSSLLHSRHLSPSLVAGCTQFLQRGNGWCRRMTLVHSSFFLQLHVSYSFPKISCGFSMGCGPFGPVPAQA